MLREIKIRVTQNEYQDLEEQAKLENIDSVNQLTKYRLLTGAKTADENFALLSQLTSLKRDIALLDAKIVMSYQRLSSVQRDFFYNFPELPPHELDLRQTSVEDRMKRQNRELVELAVHSSEVISLLVSAGNMVGIDSSAEEMSVQLPGELEDDQDA